MKIITDCNVYTNQVQDSDALNESRKKILAAQDDGDLSRVLLESLYWKEEDYVRRLLHFLYFEN